MIKQICPYCNKANIMDDYFKNHGLLMCPNCEVTIDERLFTHEIDKDTYLKMRREFLDISKSVDMLNKLNSQLRHPSLLVPAVNERITDLVHAEVKLVNQMLIQLEEQLTEIKKNIQEFQSERSKL